VSPEETAPEADPYDPKPSFWQTHVNYVAAAVVFVFTVGLTVLAFPPFKTPELAYACLVPGIYWAYRRPSFRLYAATMLGAQAVALRVLVGQPLRHTALV